MTQRDFRGSVFFNSTFLRSCFALAAVLACPAARAATAATPHASTSAEVLDVLRVRAEGDASQAVVYLPPGEEQQHSCAVVIVGAGMGGVSAAIEAAREGQTVCMTEPTLWIGGQMTSEGVSAFDDNRWIDTTGATLTYADLSHRIRAFYYAERRQSSGSVPDDRSLATFNPGNCWVSRLCFEPQRGVSILQELLQPYLSTGRVQLWLHTVPVRVSRTGRRIQSVLAYDLGNRQWLRLSGKYFVDASELGDLIQLSGLPYRVGAEAKSETGERDAADQADPKAIQSFTYPFLLLRASRGDAQEHEQAPPDYGDLKKKYTMVVDYGHGKLLTYGMFTQNPGTPGSFWDYRRSIDALQFRPAAFAGDVSMINWDSNDYCDDRLLSGDPESQAEALQQAKRLSLGFAWWLKHDVERDDNSGQGYPDLELEREGMGSVDGLSQQPYIRESRRIIPLRTIVEESLADDFQKGARAALYPDSVGIGQYAIDIHSCARKDFVSAAKPYEIPLGALIARDADNLLAASKDIGTTHITNGAYRLHPTEWSIGEAAGATIAWALQRNLPPAAIDRSAVEIAGLQRLLVKQGHPIFWFDDLPLNSPIFAAAQLAAARSWLPVDPVSLHFGAAAPLSGAEIADALEHAHLSSRITESSLRSIRLTSKPVWQDLRRAKLPTSSKRGPILRGDFALWLFHTTAER